MSTDVASLVFFSLIGVTSMITSVFIAMRFIKKCSSIFCTCEQDTTHSGQVNVTDNAAETLLQMVTTKVARNVAAMPRAYFGYDPKDDENTAPQNDEKPLYDPAGSSSVQQQQAPL